METVLLKHTQRCSDSLQQQLMEIATTMDDAVHKAQRCLRVAVAAMEDLKVYVSGLGFTDQNEEIAFFKAGKPLIYTEIFYWQELLALETDLIGMGKKERKAYLEKQLVHFRMRLARYRFILLYDKMQDSHLDHLLFVHGNKYELEDTEYSGSYDSLFVSVGSRQLALVRSLLLLTEHVNSLIEQCSKKHKKDMATVGTGLQWTGTKAQFIELIYALQAAAVINGAQLDIKQLFERISPLFGIRVTNYYSYLNAIALRKKDFAPFLKQLEQQFTRQMETRSQT